MNKLQLQIQQTERALMLNHLQLSDQFRSLKQRMQQPRTWLATVGASIFIGFLFARNKTLLEVGAAIFKLKNWYQQFQLVAPYIV